MDWIEVILYLTMGAIGSVAIIGTIVMMYLQSFRHRITVLQRINGRVIVNHIRIKEKIAKDKSKILVPNNKRIAKTIPYPKDKSVIDIDSKGNMYMTCYMTEDGQVTGWVNNDHDPAKLNTKIMTANQRSYYLTEYREAEAIGKKDLLTVIAQFAPIAILGMVIVAGLLFGPDLFQAYEKAGATLTAATDNLLETSKTFETTASKLNEVITERQSLNSVPIDNTVRS